MCLIGFAHRTSEQYIEFGGTFCKRNFDDLTTSPIGLSIISHLMSKVLICSLQSSLTVLRMMALSTRRWRMYDGYCKDYLIV